MKTWTLSIRLDKDLDALLSKVSKLSGKTRSEVAREALRRQLRLHQFESLRRTVMPFAEARGFLTDEDVFSQIQETLLRDRRQSLRDISRVHPVLWECVVPSDTQSKGVLRLLE